ncbi:extracellular solute-binding protein [Streptococcus uberis]|uniref:extracellular solute-binding protein n=1 Tax=Streptococcus uberis TaxID=1349 RepID=UPI0005419684|nr:extracellular solute-binding protein [Streptococcus uberis]KHD40845.1 sugar ABC transporter substrate-binding protein [Streptococcus hongkongensis]AUC25192.1 sugar ABC transporter substrate-binding protein [Streptococcus uberis]KKF42166.1 maltose ABC transporter substrate-binding protein [Streptococcus uberis Ab71]KKF49318.1 maltose ABC transporter substrate-binding protein [Streptococcus uberis C8329]KKF54228.1 maltose ABC transporter substrate-binding protein [Streptococcus uberis B190]
MKSWQKIIVSGASLTLASTLLVGCASDSKGKTESASSDSKTIKLWVPTGAKKSYADTVAKFEKDSGYKVKVIESEDPKAQEKIKKDATTAADVFSLPHDQLGQLVESGTIQEVPEQYTKDIVATATDQAIVGAQYKGKTYAFPFGIESQVLFYNKEKLSAEDITSYDAITSKATFGGTFKQANAYVTGPLFMSVGNTLFGENGEDTKGTNWGNEKGAAVLKWIADQKNNKGFVSLDANNVMSKFGDGSVASFESGPWDYEAAQKAIGKDKLGVAVYPKVTIGGEEVQQKAFLGVKLYAVNQAPAKGDTKRIAASYKLASYLTSAESQENQFKTRHIVPANKEIQSSEEVQSNELAKTVITMGSSKDYTVVMPKLSQMATFWTESAAILSDTFNGKIQEADYLTKLQQFDKDIASTK